MASTLLEAGPVRAIKGPQRPVHSQSRQYLERQAGPLAAEVVSGGGGGGLLQEAGCACCLLGGMKSKSPSAQSSQASPAALISVNTCMECGTLETILSARPGPL